MEYFMSKNSNKVTLYIDNKSFSVEKGSTILQAAEQNGIYIPSLCAHNKLDSYGACRLCIVELEGMRGFPTACTTPVEEGMIIKTHTPQINTMRLEILQMILSEHTSSCLICDEKDECRKSMSTIRKVGVTTGCRYCPKDGQCELQEVAEKLGLKEINYPIQYRNLPVEKEDPFYDRDYNLCILCGRCVRICQEIRGANVLAFNQRGPRTIVGPAFGRSHFEAGCEFCGACVAICPTGALAEKSNKWSGIPERELVTTCSLCGVGCQMRILVKHNKVMGVLPAEDPLVNEGQLCVKGRFCVNELVNDYQRLKKPYKIQNERKLEIVWEKALDLAAEKLTDCSPEDFGMVISPNCTNEDLYIAQKFTRIVMRSHNIDTSARLFYDRGFNEYLNLMKMSVPLSALDKASVVLCVGLDLKYGGSVVGVRLRKAIARGIKIITINPKHHSLSLTADVWLQPSSGEVAKVLDSLMEFTKGRQAAASIYKVKEEDLLKAAEMLHNALNPVILIGSDFLQYDSKSQIFKNIKKLAQNIGAGLHPLIAQNNLMGSLLMGTYPELLPGGILASGNESVDKLKESWGQAVPYFNSKWNIELILEGTRRKVLYLIGELPLKSRPASDFLIFQNIYSPHPSFEADLVFPAAAFTEVDGTFINEGGRVQRVNKAVDPAGDALPDWEILCRIAQKIGAKGFDYSNVAEIHAEISRFVDGFGDFNKLEREPNPLPNFVKLTCHPGEQYKKPKPDKKPAFLLTLSLAEHTYRGIPLTHKVDGLKKLFGEEVLIINQEDAQNAGISQGDEVIVTSTEFERIWPAWISNEQVPGTLHVKQHHVDLVHSNPYYVKIRRKDV